MKLRSLLLGTIAAVAVTSTAYADYATPTGWYMSLGAGANWIEDGDVDVYDDGSLTSSQELSYERGYIIAGTVGHDFGRWRAEFEVAYRDNDCERDACPQSSSHTDAEVWELSQMVNVLYDVPLGGPWNASVGAGIGGNLVVWKEDGINDIDDYVLAGQLIAQAGYRLSDRWELYLDYHYMIMDDPDMPLLDFPGQSYSVEKTDHSLMLALRFDLQRDGAAPPPPVDVPKGSPKQFIVFFGFNKSSLSKEARDIVHEAAAAAMQQGYVTILVTGHTDTVGSSKYNEALSVRRADNVRKALVAEGIPAAGIKTSGKGETMLMVQTGDREMEPRNRRAEINLN